jgi:hypothetical protein
MADYSFYALNILGWEEGKQNYPSPLNDNTTTFVFQKDEDAARLFLLVEFKDIKQIYSKIEVYRYDAQNSAYIYSGKNAAVTPEIKNAIDEIFGETSTRSISSKLYFDSVEFYNQIDKLKSMNVYIAYSQMLRDYEQAMILRETYKASGDTSSLAKLDDLIFGILLTYALPIEKEGDDFYIDEIAPLDPISIAYEADPDGNIGHIKVNAKIQSNILDFSHTFVWKYQLAQVDPKINIYHYDCTTWDTLTVGTGDSITLQDIVVTGKENFYLTIIACLDNGRNLAEAAGTVKLQNLHWG